MKTILFYTLSYQLIRHTSIKLKNNNNNNNLKIPSRVYDDASVARIPQHRCPHLNMSVAVCYLTDFSQAICLSFSFQPSQDRKYHVTHKGRKFSWEFNTQIRLLTLLPTMVRYNNPQRPVMWVTGRNTKCGTTNCMYVLDLFFFQRNEVLTLLFLDAAALIANC